MGMDNYAYMTNSKVNEKKFAEIMMNCTYIGRDVKQGEMFIDEVWYARKAREIHNAMHNLYREKYDDDFSSGCYLRLEKSDIEYLDKVIDIDYDEEAYEELVKCIRIADRKGYRLFYGADW